MEKQYRNIGYFFILLIPLAFIGFYKSYFSQFPAFKETESVFIHLHAVIASIWIIMLIAQPILIKNKKYKQHRFIGKLSYIIFPLLIASFVPQIIRILKSEHSLFAFFPLSDSIVLMICYSLAILYRKNIAKHMRFMIGTAIVFLGPTFGRIGTVVLELSPITTQYIQYAVTFLILAFLIWLDMKNKRKYQPYIIILSAWVIHSIVFTVLFL